MPSHGNSNKEITVAFIGYSSVGKTTALNAVLKNNFSYISKKKSTYGINYFRIQNKNHSSSSEIRRIKVAEDICCEITKDNKVHNGRKKSWNILKKGNSSQGMNNNRPFKKIFDITVDEPSLLMMDKNRRLTFADIPGIDFQNPDCPYKKYIDENWSKFDCIVLVLDLDKPKHVQSSILRYVRRNTKRIKSLPIIVLGNERGPHIGASVHLSDTEAKVDELFHVYASDKALQQLDCLTPDLCLDDDDSTDDVSTDYGYPQTPKRKPIFVSVQLQDAFRYRLAAANLSLEEVSKLGACTIDQICKDEVGEDIWRILPHDERLDVVHSALITPGEEFKVRDTNFSMLLAHLERILWDIQHGKPLGDIEDQVPVPDHPRTTACEDLQAVFCDKTNKKNISNSTTENTTTNNNSNEVDGDGDTTKEGEIPTREELRDVTMGLADELSEADELSDGASSKTSTDANDDEDEEVEVILQMVEEGGSTNHPATTTNNDNDDDSDSSLVLENEKDKKWKNRTAATASILILVILILVFVLLGVSLSKFT